MDLQEGMDLSELDNVMPGLGPSSGEEDVEAPVPSVREGVPLLFSTSVCSGPQLREGVNEQVETRDASVLTCVQGTTP